MESRHGQFSGFKFFICILKASMVLVFFNLSGKSFKILGPTNEMLSNPWYTVLTGGIVNWGFYLRLQCCSFVCSKSSVTIKEDRSVYFLYISVARIWKFRLLTETEPFFPTTFHTMSVCRNILFASNARVVYLFCHC